MTHDEFGRLFPAGQIAVVMDDAVARQLVENHPDMPRRYHNAHLLWSWVWMLTGLLSFGLIPLLFGIRHAINRSAREFVVAFALESPSFYEEAVSNRWFRLETRR